MRNLLHTIVVLLLLAGFGCQKSMDAEQMDASERAELSLVSPNPETSTIADRKIIRQATLRFQVKNLEASGERIEALVTKYGGTITNSQSYSQEESIESNYTIKVLPKELNKLVKDIQSESIFLDNKTITADDVTMQYVDVEARVKAKQAARDRYLELLQQAKKVEDVLAIEVELNKVQEELESVQAQLKALQQQTSFSTINLTMYQLVPASYTDRTSFVTRITSAISGGWQLFKTLLVGVVYLWPLLVLTIAIITVLRWYKNRQRSIV